MNDTTRRVIIAMTFAAGGIILAGYGVLVDEYLSRKR